MKFIKYAFPLIFVIILAACSNNPTEGEQLVSAGSSENPNNEIQDEGSPGSMTPDPTPDPTPIPEPDLIPTPDPISEPNPIINTIDSLSPGFWLEVPNSKMSAVFPDQNRPPGDPAGVMDAWNGGAYDNKRDRLIVWGGGHLDYGGNEIYAFDVNTLKWSRVNESGPAELCVDYYADGSPSSTHTYNSLQYLENTDRFVQAGGGVYGSNCSNHRNTNLFNFDTKNWEQGTDHPRIGHTTGRITAYDPSTGHLWVHGTYGGSQLAEYDPENDEWTLHGSGTYLEIYATAAIDPERRLLVAVGWDETMLYWDLENPGGGAISAPTLGDTSFEGTQAPGFVYDPVIKKFVGWGEAPLFIPWIQRPGFGVKSVLMKEIRSHPDRKMIGEPMVVFDISHQKMRILS